MDNNEIFENFWKDFKWPEPVKIFYRLYYNEAGEPLSYSMEDMPGKYIEITAEQFAASDPHVKVRDGKIIKLSLTRTQKLVPADSGIACCPTDISVVVDQLHPHQTWKLKQYENS